MSPTRLLPPADIIDVIPDTDNAELERLRDEILELQEQLRLAHAETARAKREATQALGALRKQLTPLYRALQSVFGQLDAAGVAQEADSPTAKVSAVWDSWKARFGATTAKVIDALLLHSELDTAQLVVAAGLAKSTVNDCIYRLNKAGLINKNGRRFSLKKLT